MLTKKDNANQRLQKIKMYYKFTWFAIVVTVLTLIVSANIIKTPLELKSIVATNSSVIESAQAINSSSRQSSVSQAAKNVEKRIKLPILMYHHIDKIENLPKTDKVGISLRVSPSIFEKQLQYLQQNNYNTINSFQLQDYLDGKFELPSNPIMLTFDDGYQDNYTNAFALLKKYKMVGDFAIITSVVGQNEYMNWDQLKEMRDAGMSLASHTHNHCTTAIKTKKGNFEESPINPGEKACSGFGRQEKLTTGQIKYEFEKSKMILEHELGIKVSHLIYPLGFYNQQAEDIAKSLGYSFATTVQPQKDNTVDFGNPFEIGRIRIAGQQTGELSGFFGN